MKILSIILLLILTSCASMTKEEEAKYNNQEAVRIMNSDRVR